MKMATNNLTTMTTSHNNSNDINDNDNDNNFNSENISKTITTTSTTTTTTATTTTMMMMTTISSNKLSMDQNNDDKELIEKLLRMIKREVKQIMEEAVTRKFVHEDSGSITSLCAAVDACLSHGLKRRALGLFKTNSTTALLQKVAKNFDIAALVLKKVQEIENIDPNKRSSSSSDSLQSRNRMSFKMKSNQQQQTLNNNNNNNNTGTISSNNNNSNSGGSGSGGGGNQSSSPTKYRFLWIRIALFEKYLVSIVDHVVKNSSKYYERDALVSDPVAGQIFASLLVGPCALDYTKIKTQDQYWTDPPADELVQRHRISSSVCLPNPVTNNSTATGINQSTPPSSRRPLGMNYRKNFTYTNGVGNEQYLHHHYYHHNYDEHQSSGSPILRTSSSNICWSPKDYVESLHQNSKSTLLYGKNNVIMQPIDDQEPMPGYLSLHQDSNGLSIKWTPNQLINGRVNQPSSDGNNDGFFNHSMDKTSAFWNYALNVNVENIVYLHCHQHKLSYSSIVMVGRDGVMHPPIKFPKGGHLLAFLSCLENGLVPYGQLDPPLWSENGKGHHHNGEQRNDQQQSLDMESDDITADYVFRVISINDKPDTISAELFEPKLTQKQSEFLPKSNDENQPQQQQQQQKPEASPSCQQIEIAVNETKTEIEQQQQFDNIQNIQLLCNTMKKQIISRAFYGWLAYCRHLKTVRTHLADLVNTKIYRINEPTDASKGITKDLWENHMFSSVGKISMDPMEFYRLVYFGGIEHSIRSKVWLYLLGHYHFDDDNEEKNKHDIEMREKYEMIMSEWLAVEAIVRQRDKEIVAANLAKLSSESQNDSTEMSVDKSIYHQSNKMFTNEVFEENEEFESRKSSIQSNSEQKNIIEAECPMVTDDIDDNNRENEKMIIETNHTTNNCRKPLIRHNKISESVTSASSITSIHHQNIIITNPSVDRIIPPNSLESLNHYKSNGNEEDESIRLPINSMESGGAISSGGGGGGGAGSQCVSPASSNGGLYSNELLDLFSLNLHRIDKDVQRCDRNFWYFTKENLEKLRNIMCTYVWEHLDIGYVQGMCDLVAPLLVIFDDEVYTYSCFCKLMIRMTSNFPHGGAMDTHFANMRSLIQILDSDIFELMHQNGDYTHFYFCYRWFLLDFKRELIYADVFSVWETIWAAKHVSSSSFVLFIALALVEYYRDIILENNMDFTDIIKFFNEMADRHDAKAVLNIARDLVHQIQTLMENDK
ncbi:small G protein signaling modulator 2-like isoform X2 [Dermatophagoides pteronyssinus]|uniref:small G protein signaling modulator 2-like isoform X2 n=1 Tax=Dermatophagoides pteronyssinus TaxID=6956 RepID=UPI003F680173